MAYYKDINFFYPKRQPEVVDAEAVRQELAMLFNTRTGSRLFNPDYGIDLESSLFDLMNVVSSNSLFFEIADKIKRYVGSVNLDMAKSNVTPDAENNRYIIELYFTINGIQDQKFEMIKTFSR